MLPCKVLVSGKAVAPGRAHVTLRDSESVIVGITLSQRCNIPIANVDTKVIAIRERRKHVWQNR